MTRLGLTLFLYIYHFDTSDQKKSQGYISHIALTTGQYLDIALTTTVFDAEAATKHQFPLIVYYRDA